MAKRVTKNILTNANRQPSPLRRYAIMGLPSSKGPNFMYFKVRNVSNMFERMRTIVSIVNVFSLLI
tara:strand:+ start:179 stop:376 length:198 start_codon:yes stop_codon:yes gene_type:complete